MLLSLLQSLSMYSFLLNLTRLNSAPRFLGLIVGAQCDILWGGVQDARLKVLILLLLDSIPFYFLSCEPFAAWTTR
jgi:hypothetical protein